MLLGIILCSICLGILFFSLGVWIYIILMWKPTKELNHMTKELLDKLPVSRDVKLDGHQLVATLDFHDSMTEEEIKAYVAIFTRLADSIHRVNGGNGLKLDDLKVYTVTQAPLAETQL